jgi:aspartate carbamoyltransferase catalytic subunit
MKSLHSVFDISDSQVKDVFDLADLPKSKQIRKSLGLLFFEPSTRTKLSFELAAKNLGINVLDFNPSSSSLSKGETFRDTISTFASFGIDALIIRHKSTQASTLAEKISGITTINAGDGRNQHPTQALLDLYTIKKYFNNLNQIRLCIVGDLLHSRVANSNLHFLKRFGIEVSILAPSTLIPKNLTGFKVHSDINSVIDNCNIVMCLRLQQERMTDALIPSKAEYFKYYGFKQEYFNRNKELFLMHPGPVNYNIDIADNLQSERNLINEQVANGVKIRQALLEYML